MWNEFMYQVRLVCDNDPSNNSSYQLSKKGILTTEDGASSEMEAQPHFWGFHGCFKSSLPRMTDLLAREKMVCRNIVHARALKSRERKRRNAANWINDSASTSAFGAVEIKQGDGEIASILTPHCVGIDCVRSSFMKTHWSAASARFSTTFVNNPFGHKCDVRDRDSFHANTITSCVAANAISDDPIEHLRSAPESEVLLARQDLAISEAWMEDSMPMNVLGFDLRSYCNTT
ncbi:uncharacterized protein TNCV_826251 [Trichonephila clavipes]|nr:uncharacterized protein TNCV_826251 [Trichonephila clavipes]